jgi:hypothetical protein
MEMAAGGGGGNQQSSKRRSYRVIGFAPADERPCAGRRRLRFHGS